MVCSELLIGSLIVVVVYFVARKIISRLRIDRYTDVYVLITGCDTGFGNIAAKRFDRMGCHVFAGCLTEKGREGLKQECSDRLHAISLNVAKTESIREAYDYVKANIPEGRGLWGVINNAGVFGKMGPLEFFSRDDYRDVFDINLYGVIDVTMTFLPLIKKARGRIINTASIAGRCAFPGIIPYCISKYGVEAFTDGLRRSLRPFGVKAVIIEPGTHKTNLTSAQNYNNLMTAAWNGASADAKAEYGEDYLKLSIEANINAANNLGSEKLTDVVDAYEEGLLGRYPRARYPVGMDCYTLLFIEAFPEWFSDWVMVSLLKAPRPAVLK